jgi:hypothetical protein
MDSLDMIKEERERIDARLKKRFSILIQII